MIQDEKRMPLFSIDCSVIADRNPVLIAKSLASSILLLLYVHNVVPQFSRNYSPPLNRNPFGRRFLSRPERPRHGRTSVQDDDCDEGEIRTSNVPQTFSDE